MLQPENKPHRKWAFSLDTWAVFLALAAAALVRLHVITHVKW
jgi:hypothetical protein